MNAIKYYVTFIVLTFSILPVNFAFSWRVKHPTIIYRSGNVSLGQQEHASLGQLKHHVFLFAESDSVTLTYKAFCAGSIISPLKVLSSAHCVLSNRKRLVRSLGKVRVVAGVLEVLIQKNSSENHQWRSIKKIYSQKYFRFPAYSLAVLMMNIEWDYNQYIGSIPIATRNRDFDGVCAAPAIRTLTSWATEKVLFMEPMKVVEEDTCELMLQRYCGLYYCTAYEKTHALATKETAGGGLICKGTGDPAEKDKGVLVGVTTLINVYLPTLHNRVGMFHDWVEKSAFRIGQHKVYLFCSMLVTIIISLLT